MSDRTLTTDEVAEAIQAASPYSVAKSRTWQHVPPGGRLLPAMAAAAEDVLAQPRASGVQGELRFIVQSDVRGVYLFAELVTWPE